jgi:cytochrome bd-type quinol oxidase subunit 2
MIQRIQTLYWSVAILLVIVVFLISNVIEFQIKGEVSSVKSSFIFIVLSLVFILSAVLAILNFKKIKKQLQFAKLSIIFSLFLGIYLVFIKFLAHKIYGIETSTIKLDIGFYLTLVTLPLSFLAYSGVKRDKNLLDSLDRLR